MRCGGTTKFRGSTVRWRRPRRPPRVRSPRQRDGRKKDIEKELADLRDWMHSHKNDAPPATTRVSEMTGSLLERTAALQTLNPILRPRASADLRQTAAQTPSRAASRPAPGDRAWPWSTRSSRYRLRRSRLNAAVPSSAFEAAHKIRNRPDRDQAVRPKISTPTTSGPDQVWRRQ